MSNTPPMGWTTRIYHYARRNDAIANMHLTPRQLRRWNKKHRAEIRRARGGQRAEGGSGA